MRILILLCLLPSCYCIFGIGFDQTVGVWGKVYCNGEPAANVEIVLIDKGMIFDEKLAETKTERTGIFVITGTVKNLDFIPRLYIYHKCNQKGPCYKKFIRRIHPKYVAKGVKVKELYHATNLELSRDIQKQPIDCRL